MEKKKFDDNFLEPVIGENISKPHKINLEEFREQSSGFCDSFFNQFSKCKDNSSIMEADICNRIEKNLLECLKAIGKIVE
jgi:hypothetical protein